MQTRIETIDAATLHEWMAEDAVLLIDVREAQEHTRAHIPGATLKSLSRLGTAELPDAGGRKVVVYCASGMRSLMAADRLLADHYGGVGNLDGGIAAWQLAGYQVEQDETAQPRAMPGLFSMARGAG